jgi:hypothetical protein
MPIDLTKLLLCLLGAAIGFRLPDIDLAPVLFIRHRSFWTHGPLLPFLAALLATRYPDYRFVAIAFVAGIAIHLLEDAMPKQWRGGAFINLFPIPISLPLILSQCYIILSALYTASVLIALL